MKTIMTLTLLLASLSSVYAQNCKVKLVSVFPKDGFELTGYSMKKELNKLNYTIVDDSYNGEPIAYSTTDYFSDTRIGEPSIHDYHFVIEVTTRYNDILDSKLEPTGDKRFVMAYSYTKDVRKFHVQQVSGPDQSRYTLPYRKTSYSRINKIIDANLFGEDKAIEIAVKKAFKKSLKNLPDCK